LFLMVWTWALPFCCLMKKVLSLYIYRQRVKVLDVFYKNRRIFLEIFW
jgi:hypothetical protein